MASSESPPQPDFITFLISEKPKFDCHFIVGEETLVKPERIGAVKLMLMAHSVVFRSELEESGLKEKGDVALKDVYPDTFKDLLKFVYGQDITGDLEFDEADNMFYVAEKYMMSYLKNKLALRLIALLTPQNVCSLMNNPAISMQLQLKSAITQILRHETDKVLASPLFLDVCPEGFISILQQDGLAVPEIELWRAAIKWAKKRADSEDGQVLRQQISGISKHLRICTLTGDQFCQEVSPTRVLNTNEVELVVQSIGEKRKYDELTEFSNVLEPRKRLHKKVKLVKRQASAPSADIELKLTNPCDKVRLMKSNFTILTKTSPVELLPLTCLAFPRQKMDPEGWTYRLNCIVTITQWISRDSLDKSPLTIKLSKDVEFGKTFEVPLAVDGYNVTLLPNTKYHITMMATGFVGGCIVGYKYSNRCIYENEHMVMSVDGGLDYCYTFPSNCLRYRLVNDV